MAQALVALIRILLDFTLYIIVYLKFCYFFVEHKRTLVEHSSTQLFSTTVLKYHINQGPQLLKL